MERLVAVLVAVAGLAGGSCVPVDEHGATPDGGAAAANAAEAANAEPGLATADEPSEAPGAQPAAVPASPPGATASGARAPRAAGRLVYPVGRTHSPLTPEVAASLLELAMSSPSQDEHALAKIGDSLTDTPRFLACFAGRRFDLGRHAALAETVDHFRAGRVGGESPLARVSLAARAGWAARGPLNGTPTWLDAELAATTPRYAVVMLGTSDVEYRAHDQFGSDLWAITDELIARGVIPILSTIPPLGPTREGADRVEAFNLVIRGLAQGRLVPLVDLHRELRRLDGDGLARGGVNLGTGGDGACDLTAAGLTDGYNVRNLLTLEALDRVRRVIADDAPPVEAPDAAPRRAGSGAHADPVRGTLPLADLADTRDGDALLSDYAGCGGAVDGAGPEVVYEFQLPSATTLDARVVDRDDVDVDVHILVGRRLDTARCVARGDQRATAAVAAGTAWVVVDSHVGDDGEPRAGEFILSVERR
jgi:hypothetical protein